MLTFMNRGSAFYRDVGRLALPIILQNLIASSLALADTLMVGLLPGDEPMAAVTLANIPIFVIQLMIFGLQSGASVLISQFWGKGDRESINRVLGIGLYVAGVFTALLHWRVDAQDMLTDMQLGRHRRALNACKFNSHFFLT